MKTVESSGRFLTTFECRGCGRYIDGYSDGTFCGEGWNRIIHIDGPNAICPACIHDNLEDVLQSLREDGYENACLMNSVQFVHSKDERYGVVVTVVANENLR